MDYITLGIIVTAAISIILILLQDRSSGGAGGAFGGGEVGGAYQKRRGAEKMIFILTIVFISAFAGLSLWNLAGREKVNTPAETPEINLGDIKVEGTTTDGEKVDVQVKPVE